MPESRLKHLSSPDIVPDCLDSDLPEPYSLDFFHHAAPNRGVPDIRQDVMQIRPLKLYMSGLPVRLEY
jgi:hypothetical protein